MEAKKPCNRLKKSWSQFRRYVVRLLINEIVIVPIFSILESTGCRDHLNFERANKTSFLQGWLAEVNNMAVDRIKKGVEKNPQRSFCPH